MAIIRSEGLKSSSALTFTLGDDAGSHSFIVEGSTGSDILSILSDGGSTFSDTLEVSGNFSVNTDIMNYDDALEKVQCISLKRNMEIPFVWFQYLIFPASYAEEPMYLRLVI